MYPARNPGRSVPASIRCSRPTSEMPSVGWLIPGNLNETGWPRSGFGPVALGDDLVLCEEIDDRPALRLDVGELRRLHAAERQVGDRGGDADVDADHSHLRLELELARVVAVLGVDRRAVAVLVVVDDPDGLVERRGLEDHLHRPEDLGLVDLH